MRVKTVAINRDGVKVIINQSDFMAGVHELWTDVDEITPNQPFEPKGETIQEEADKAAAVRAGEIEDEKKTRLIAELKEFGIKKDKRCSVETLENLLEEARQ